MAPLLVLLSVFALAKSRLQTRHAGRVALAGMLMVTGVTHFTSTADLAAMVPPQLPAPEAIIYLTGVVELLLAALLLAPLDAGLRRLLGWGTAALFVGMLPANVYSAWEEVGLGGHGASYLWFRVPLQVLFIGWAVLCTRAVPLRNNQ